MKRGSLLLSIAIVFSILGCKKDKMEAPSLNDYLPLTNGSVWKYSYGSDGGHTDTLAITMTGGTTRINGKTYYDVTSTYKQGFSQGYFYAGNHFYAMRTVALGSDAGMEVQLLNDTASVGYRWITRPTDDGTVGGMPVQAVNTIVEKGISRTENGRTFSEVIHTRVELQYDYGSGYQTNITYDFYLAKGVGLIESHANTLEFFFETENLFDYTIK
jgi:hypothetical protein